MGDQTFSLQQIWDTSEKGTPQKTDVPFLKFEDITSKLISMGPYYYYIIDFFDMSLSNVSDSIKEIHGFEPNKVTLDDIVKTIHPDDMNFVITAEDAINKFYYEELSLEQRLKYKMNYSFRSKMADGTYALLNHQVVLLTLNQNGGVGRSLNIHTRIDHISDKNNYKYSLIGLDGEPSYMNIEAYKSQHNLCFSNREIEIIKLLAEGHDNKTIADLLFISEWTVKKHRSNILKKADAKNTTQLVKNATLSGLI